MSRGHKERGGGCFRDELRKVAPSPQAVGLLMHKLVKRGDVEEGTMNQGSNTFSASF